MKTTYRLIRKNGYSVLYVPEVDQYICIDLDGLGNVTFWVAYDKELVDREPLEWDLWLEDGLKEATKFLSALNRLCTAAAQKRQK
jgi:hypothetical protein